MNASDAAAAPDDIAPPPGRTRAIALLAASTLFMESLDGTIVAIALPDMARYFRADVVDMNIGIAAYLVALAVLLPLSTWATERWGPRHIFALAVGLFTLASLACAASQTLTAFVIARLFQGAAAAMMTPVARVVVLRHTERNELMNAIALLTWPAMIAPAVAPLLGGLIVQYLSWQWIFLLNVPIGIVGIVAALRLLPRRSPEAASSADWYGLLVWAIAATLVVGGIESAGRLSPPVMLAVLGGGFAAALIGWRHFRARPRPLLDVRLIGRHRSLTVAVIEGSAFRSSILANPFLLPLYFHVGLGKPIAETGLLIMVGMAGNMGMKTFTSPILRRFGFQRVLAINGLLLGISFAVFMLTGHDTSFFVMATLLLLSGLSRSMQFTTLNTLAFADVAPDEMARANTVLSTSMQINGAMGVAIGALALQIGARLHGAATVAAFHFAFGVIALVAVLAGLSCMRLDRALGYRLVGDDIAKESHD